MNNQHVKKLNNFLEGVSDFFDLTTLSNGVNVCKKHGVEHTGKTVYSVGIDLYLHKVKQDVKFLERANKRLHRVATLLKEKDGKFFFTSDGSERWNMSNHIIDSGAAADMFATALKHVNFNENEKAYFEDILRKNCDTYLSYAVLEKAHTNQRLWGATGLAAGYDYFRVASWQQAILNSVEMSIEEICSDGSIPYVTDHQKYKTDPSIADTTNYYHSRHIVFLIHALEQLNVMNADWFNRFESAAHFLKAFYQADGKKCMHLETKRWYFNSCYEVASNSYDVYAFLKAYEYTGDEEFAHFALAALSQLIDHQQKRGGIRDHLGGVENFQCPYFWNSHTLWLTRIVDQLSVLPSHITATIPDHFDFYENAQVINFKNDKYSAIVRGGKKPRTPIWGPRLGGGSLIYFSTPKYRSENLVAYSEVSLFAPGNFYKFSFLLSRLTNVNKSDLRRMLYYMLIELRASDLKTAVYRLIILIRHTCFNTTLFSSANAVDNNLQQANKNEYLYKGCICSEKGERIDGCKISRSYRFDDDALIVEHTLESDKDFSGIFMVPKFASISSVNIDGECKTVSNNSSRIRLRSVRICRIKLIHGV